MTIIRANAHSWPDWSGLRYNINATLEELSLNYRLDGIGNIDMCITILTLDGRRIEFIHKENFEQMCNDFDQGRSHE